jgi:hypothetical protein
MSPTTNKSDESEAPEVEAARRWSGATSTMLLPLARLNSIAFSKLTDMAARVNKPLL